VKLVGSWKIESGVDKGDVREIVIILTSEFKQISRLLF
jgi:hypothetical protein